MTSVSNTNALGHPLCNKSLFSIYIFNKCCGLVRRFFSSSILSVTVTCLLTNCSSYYHYTEGYLYLYPCAVATFDTIQGIILISILYCRIFAEVRNSQPYIGPNVGPTSWVCIITVICYIDGVRLNVVSAVVVRSLVYVPSLFKFGI